jgi:hypothetical protein
MNSLLTTLRGKVCLTVIAVAAGVPAARGSDTTKLLWRDPGIVSQRNLFWGSGSAERAPKAPFTFLGEDASGSKPKINVRDANGVTWSVKLTPSTPGQNEVHAEIAATRLVWALEYFVDENYYVSGGRVDGTKDLKRAAAVVGPGGSFNTARFERRPEGSVIAGEWDLENGNAFVGSRELSGLHMLAMLVGNWDLPPSNNAIIRVRLPSGDSEERFFISDWGSSFGRMRGGADKRPTRWDLADYTESRFLTGVVRGNLEFRNPLMGNKPLAIPLEHARWWVGLASQLSDAQIRQAFEPRASAGEVAGF